MTATKRATKIIATVGPASIKPEVLKKFADRDLDYVRINLSHTKTEDIEERILQIKQAVATPIIIDTAGPQIRTGFVGQSDITLETGQAVKVFDKIVSCSRKQLYLRPLGLLEYLEPGDLISIDFNNLLLKVKDFPDLTARCVDCAVVIGGRFGNNKAVTVENKNIVLPPLSKKDLIAIAMAKKHGIDMFSLSFVSSQSDIIAFKKAYPAAHAIAKVETREAIGKLDEIISAADSILIDRGDLSREIALEKIAMAQKIIIKKCNDQGKDVYIATNILETMTSNVKPTRAEINDVFSCILDGATGFVLTKETAVGKYPVETYSFLVKICEQAELTKKDAVNLPEQLSYLSEPSFTGGLIEPHGGVLVNRMVKEQPASTYLDSLPRLAIDENDLMDAEQIAIGTYSPLAGFQTKKEIDSVLNNMRLISGEVWTVPIMLQISSHDASQIHVGETVVLAEAATDEAYVLLEIEDMFVLNKQEFCRKMYGTSDQSHPGVKIIYDRGDMVIGGGIRLLKRRPSKYKHYELTPRQSRHIFESMGWSKVVGFHSRNVPHLSHEYIQFEGMKRAQADGIFGHPVIGKKKSGDFTAEAIIKGYELMEKEVYPSGKAVFATYATFSRYAGPREAVFTALCRKNFGCSHFIVGRDHTGVGNFYGPHESHQIFDKFPDLGIIPVRFDTVVFCRSCGSHIEKKLCPHDSKFHGEISGTEARNILKKQLPMPTWFMRPEMTSLFSEMQKRGQKIFTD